MAVNFENTTDTVQKGSLTAAFIRLLLSILHFLLPGPTLSLVNRVFFTPHKYRPYGKNMEVLARGESFSFTSDDTLVQAWRWGKGPAVIFSHGWAGRGIQFSPYFEPLITRGFSIICYDAPGHGESGSRTSSYFQLANCLRDLLRHLGDTEIRAVVGHSLGACAAVNYLAAARPAFRTVLIAPAIQLNIILERTFGRLGVPLKVFRKLIKRYEKKFGHIFAEENPVDLLNKINSDILIIHDRGDRMTPYSDSLEASQDHQNIRLHTCEGLGHKKLIWDEKITEIIIKYITEDEGNK